MLHTPSAACTQRPSTMHAYLSLTAEVCTAVHLNTWMHLGTNAACQHILTASRHPLTCPSSPATSHLLQPPHLPPLHAPATCWVSASNNKPAQAGPVYLLE
jgi:hypothetical protein